jgi:trimethylamine--corrinoid protein Co-methyltransferase
MTAMLPALTGSNIIYGMGMLEMGMTMSYEQLLIDQEIVRMIRRILGGIAVNKETIALDVIKKVGASGNYLAELHTLKNMRKESSQAKLIDRKMRSGWEKDGSKDMAERAREEARSILENYKPLPLPEDAAQKIRSIIEEAEDELLNE